jgi:hypothetical protein
MDDVVFIFLPRDPIGSNAATRGTSERCTHAAQQWSNMSWINQMTIHAHSRSNMRKETFPSLDNMQNNRSPPQGVFQRSSVVNWYGQSCKTSGPNRYDYGWIARRRRLPKAAIARKYFHGHPLVGDEKLRQMPTHMRNLHPATWLPQSVSKQCSW